MTKAAEKDAREKEFLRQQSEYARAVESRRACIAVAAENIKALRSAQVTGTIAKLSPIPPQYNPRQPTSPQHVAHLRGALRAESAANLRGWLPR